MKTLGVFALALLVAFLAASIFSEKGALKSTASVEGARIEGLSILNRREGIPRWILTAERALLDETGKTANLQNVMLEMPEEGLVVGSPSGEYNLKEETLLLEGGVEAERGRERLRTESARLEAGGRVISDRPVLFRAPGLEVSGNGFRFPENEWVIKENVRTTIYPSKDDDPSFGPPPASGITSRP